MTKSTSLAVRQLIQSGVVGALATLALLVIVGILLHQIGVLQISFRDISSLQVIFQWLTANVGLAIIPFVLLLLLYLHTLKNINAALEGEHDTGLIVHLEHQLDIWISLFFGVGVIWTTIGLRSALISALGGLDAQTAAELGAFAILQRLVEGGILLALSTTIIGGVGGYLMRLIKSISVGNKLKQYYVMEQNRFFDPLFARLEDSMQQSGGHSNPTAKLRVTQP